MKVKSDKYVKSKFKSYPKEIKPKLELLRKLVLETAEADGAIDEIEETLKWGEPSYLVKKGSTIRMDWKEKKPEQYAMYFKCTSKLVPTFKKVFGNTFNYETTRAIVFSLNDPIPTAELKSCISMALNYHKVKNKELLGYT